MMRYFFTLIAGPDRFPYGFHERLCRVYQADSFSPKDKLRCVGEPVAEAMTLGDAIEAAKKHCGRRVDKVETD